MGLEQKFSLEEFQRAGMGTDSARSLADELAEIVQERIHASVADAVAGVVEDLKVLGHDLREYTKPVPGDIAYRDDEGSNGGYVCRLRLGVDTIVSTGFGDTTDAGGD